MPTWSELRDLIEHGSAAPIRATVTLWGEPDGSQFGWVMGGERIASLVLGPGTYRLARHHRACAVEELDGTPRLVDDGERVVVMSDSCPLDGTGRFALTSSAGMLFSHARREEELGEVYPAGPVEKTMHGGRAAWLVPGLPRQRYGAPEMPRSMVVDAATGVVVRIDNGDGGGELTDIECPESFAPGAFSWGAGDTQKYGAPGEPEPLRSRERPDTPSRAMAEDVRRHEPPFAEFAGFLEGFSGPTPEPVPDGHRHLRIVGGPGHEPHSRGERARDWAQGRPGEFALGFVEAGDSGSFDEKDYSTIVEPYTVRAWAEPVVDGEPVDQRMNGNGFRWQTVLRGDGWTALWSADRPTTGYVELVGVFYAESDYAHYYSPTRGVVAGIQLDYELWGDGDTEPASVSRIDVETTSNLPDWSTGPWFGTTGFRYITIDIDAAEPPAVSQAAVPADVHDFALSRNGDQTVLWRPEGRSVPALWRTSLITGDSRRVLIPVPVRTHLELHSVQDGPMEVRCRHGVFLIDDDDTVSDGDVSQTTDIPGDSDVQPHPDGGAVVLNSREAEDGWSLLMKLGRLRDGDVHWVEEGSNTGTSPGDVLRVVGGRIFTGVGRVLTLRDRDLQVVRRFAMRYPVNRLNVVGPWLGRWTFRNPGTNASERRYQLIDPADVHVSLDIPVAEPSPCVQWFDGELWIADGRLRVFTPQQDGTWTSRDIELPG